MAKNRNIQNLRKGIRTSLLLFVYFSVFTLSISQLRTVSGFVAAISYAVLDSMLETIMWVSKAKKGEGEGENESISSIISFLRSAFRPGDFEKAERMLTTREEGLIFEKDALEVELTKRLEELRETRENVVNVEKELEIYRTKCSQLAKELEKKNKDCFAISIKLGDLEFRNVSLVEELEVYKRRCDGLRQQITRLEEDRNVACERENRAEERIVSLSEELKKMERAEKEKYANLQRENSDLELAKKKGYAEIEFWKKRCKDLEIQLSQLDGETSAFMRIEKSLFGNRDVEPGSLHNDGFGVERTDKDENKMSKLECETNDGTKVCLSQLPSKEKLSSNQQIQTPVKADSTCQSPTPHKGSNCSLMAESLPSFFLKEETKSISSESDMENRRSIKNRQVSKKGWSNKKPSTSKMDSTKSLFTGTIDIIESDDETGTIPNQSSMLRGDSNVAHIPLDHDVEEAMDEQELASQKRLKRTHSVQKAEENWSSHRENFPVAERARKKTAPKMVICNSVSEDDETPIGKLLQTKKLQELGDIQKPTDSLMSDCFQAPAISLNDENAEGTINLRLQLIPLRHCKVMVGRPERNSSNHLEKGGILHESGVPTSRDAKESNVTRARSENVAEGFCKSDDSDSEDSSSNIADACGNDSAISQVFSHLVRMRKHKRLKWQYESDMLSSFEGDPELCLMAVCALYRQQTSDKKSMKDSLQSIKRGFSKFDVLRGSVLAEFLMDGNREGDLKKSVKELDMYDPKGLEECKRLAIRYSRQLFSIYQGREDPFFLSS